MHWLDNTVQDLRFALRSWGRAPVFFSAAVSTLAIGIGANTAIFSLVSGVLLRPLPYRDPQNLVQVHEIQPRNNTTVGFDRSVVFQDFEEWKSQSRLVEGMITYTRWAKNFEAGGELEQVTTVAAERGLFRLLGVRALAGRGFDDHDSQSVAVVSYCFWQRFLGGDPGAIGRGISLDGQPFTVIGVMPEGFQFPYASSSTAVWIPWEMSAELRSHPNRRLDAVVARLKPGVGMEAAREELTAMQAVRQSGRQVRIRSLMEVVSGAVRESLLVLLGAVGMVLLVACLNVANLLLARTAAREREIATRAAVGAGRLRLIRQLLTESLVLAFAGGLAGLGIGVLGMRLLLRLAGAQVPRAGEIGFDWRVFALLLGMCTVAGIGFGLAPAIAGARGVAGRLARRNTGSAIRDALVVVEIALAFVLLVGAGLLLRTFVNLRRTDPGLNAENVLTIHVVLSGAQESMAIEERVARIPGVRAAGLISLLPLQDSNWSGGFTIPGRTTDVHESELRYVTPGYFRAMGIPLRRGRVFSASDEPSGDRVILINEALARLYFQNEDAVGWRLDRGTIVGVVGDVRQSELGTVAKPEIYYLVAQNFGQIRSLGSTLVVRGYGPPQRLTSAIRAAVPEVRPGQALFRVATMQEVIEESIANPRMYAGLMGVFAAISTLLAMAGIYGVVSYLVTMRTREFGIRMALGAGPARVLRFVMNRSAWLTALGLGLGLCGAAAVTRILRNVLYGVGVTDSLTFAAVAMVLAVTALGASLMPARRAARVDPSVALRCE